MRCVETGTPALFMRTRPCILRALRYAALARGADSSPPTDISDVRGLFDLRSSFRVKQVRSCARREPIASLFLRLNDARNDIRDRLGIYICC